MSYHTAPIRVFEAITREIDNIDWKSNFESLDCNESFNYFSKIYHSLCNKYIREKRSSFKKNDPWINHEIRTLIREKHKIWYKKNKPDWREEYRKICAKVKREIWIAKLNYER